MAVLAQSYPEYNERGNVMGVALSGGIALGVLIGPTFGGFMYEFVGQSSPFLILAILSFIGALLQTCIIYPEVKQTNKDSPSVIGLMKDPYILIVTGSLIIANMAVAMLQSSLPIIMMDRMEVDLWQIGATFLPCSLSYMIGTCVFGRIASCIGRWLTSLLGLYLIGIAFVFVSFAYTPEFLIGPMALTGFGIGMVDSSMLPELGNLVDLRHSANYGSVYALGDIAICLGFVFGPALSGGLAKLIGFKWMAVFTSLICFAYGPLLFIIKTPQRGLEEQEKEEIPLIGNSYDQHGPKYDISNDEIMRMSEHD
jgi:DHA1 family solute carrier family 18 vesicular amine transporter 1/2